jgi:hypothetical protein
MGDLRTVLWRRAMLTGNDPLTMTVAASAKACGGLIMPSFTTVDDQLARRLRVALLVGRRVTGTTAGHAFTRARIRAVRRDLFAIEPRWTIDIEEDEAAEALEAAAE